MKISTSILSIENDKIKIDKVINSTTDGIHLDIMDGKFVSSKTIDDDLIISYLKKCQKPIDIHFMTYNVKEYVKKYEVLKPLYMIFHYETGENILDIIKYIKSKNIKAGIAINPKTDVNLIKDILPYIDLVLIMSVEPGRGGQEFMLSSINKINELSQKAIYISDFNQIVSYVKENAKPNDIVLTLGAGTVTKIGPMLCNNS